MQLLNVLSIEPSVLSASHIELWNSAISTIILVELVVRTGNAGWAPVLRTFALWARHKFAPYATSNASNTTYSF
jgi:hypothetical protein